MLLFIPVLLAIPGEAGAECIAPAFCYCALVPGECDTLVTAEVVDSDTEWGRLRVSGTPHYDPEGILSDGVIVSGIEPCYPEARVGDVGLFRLYQKEACGSQTTGPTGCISLIETDGKYLCDTYPDFSGATLGVVVDTVLSDDCETAAFELMKIEDYCEGESGCCYQTMPAVESSLMLALFGIAVFKRRQR
jgi:hypothetical protein